MMMELDADQIVEETSVNANVGEDFDYSFGLTMPEANNNNEEE